MTESSTHRIAIDDESPVSIYRKNFKRCIGTGRAALSLRQDLLDNLRIIQDEIGFAYIRGHGLFHDDMGVFRRRVQMDAKRSHELAQPVYNWIYVQKVIDNYRSVGIKPFIELGFMPEQMASSQETVFWWKGNVSSPKVEEDWGELVERLARFLIRQYGMEEVRTWPFEVWNEPNSSFWEPLDGDREGAYYRLYETAARALKRVDPGLRVGGPATNPSGFDWIPRFIRHCRSANIPLDFITHHVYSGHNKRYEGEYISMDLMEPSQPLEQFARAAKLVRDSAEESVWASVGESAGENTESGESLPLHITEWNTSYSCIDRVHDTALNAAYIAWMLTHADSLADSYAYWVASDVFEEADIPRSLFHGGFGLLTHNGLRKPVFHAFRFANELYEMILHLDPYACVTRNEEDGSLAILLFNPVINAQSGEPAPFPISISLQLPFAEGEAVVVIESVDGDAGNAYEAWKKFGSPRIPDKAVLAVLRRAQHPRQDTSSILVGADRKLRLDLRLPPNGLKLVKVYSVPHLSKTVD
jgi:xylan 1,4-beta-xylosidase